MTSFHIINRALLILKWKPLYLQFGTYYLCTCIIISISPLVICDSWFIKTKFGASLFVLALKISGFNFCIIQPNVRTSNDIHWLQLSFLFLTKKFIHSDQRIYIMLTIFTGLLVHNQRSIKYIRIVSKNIVLLKLLKDWFHFKASWKQI